MDGYGLLDQMVLGFIGGCVRDGGVDGAIIVALTASAGFYTLHRSGAWSRAVSPDRSGVLRHYLAATLVGGLLVATAILYARLGFGETPPHPAVVTLYFAATLIAAAAAFRFTVRRAAWAAPAALRFDGASRFDAVAPALAGAWLLILAVPVFRFSALVRAG